MRTTEQIRTYLFSQLEIDEHNEDVINLICEYFGNDESFEQKGEQFSLDKGLFISGNIGCGKTSLMKLMEENRKRPYKVVGCRTLADLFGREGDEGIEKYCNIREYRDYTLGKNMRTIYPYCFDDLGTEPGKKYFGNDVNVMLDILLRRYDKGDFTFTHITTNLSAEELKTRYGNRLTSRFKEMFNFISFPATAPDRRR